MTLPLLSGACLLRSIANRYSPVDSDNFTKTVVELRGAAVYIEATELGDVLATSGLPWLQGAETPFENSSALEVLCGQAQTITFYATLLDGPAPAPSAAHPALPAGSDAGDPMNAQLTPVEYEHSWSWRRSFVPDGGNRSLFASNTGDISQQNNGPQDLRIAYPFLAPADALAPVTNVTTTRDDGGDDDDRSFTTAGWNGGLNTTVLRMMEDRSFAWFRVLQNSSAQFNETWPVRLRTLSRVPPPAPPTTPP